MALVPTIAHGKISMACDIHCSSRPTTLYCEVYVCVYSFHISDRVETVYELPLLSNNTASETFLRKPGAVQSVDWIFITEAPA